MPAKERRSLWFDWFDKLTNQLTNRLSKQPLVADSGAFDWFDRLTNRRLVSRLVSQSNQSNYRHRTHASAYFVDHFQKR
jgi:hypothetical protein